MPARRANRSATEHARVVAVTADGRVRLAASQPWLVDAAQTWMAGVNNAGAANTWKLQDPTGRRVTGTGIGSR